MSLYEGAETYQGDTVLAVECAGDFIQYGVEYSIGLILCEIGLVGDSGCEFRFANR